MSLEVGFGLSLGTAPSPRLDVRIDLVWSLHAGGRGREAFSPWRCAHCRDDTEPLMVLHGRDADHPVATCVEARRRAVTSRTDGATDGQQDATHLENWSHGQCRLHRREVEMHRQARDGQVERMARSQRGGLAGIEQGLLPSQLERSARSFVTDNGQHAARRRHGDLRRHITRRGPLRPNPLMVSQALRLYRSTNSR